MAIVSILCRLRQEDPSEFLGYLIRPGLEKNSIVITNSNISSSSSSKAKQINPQIQTTTKSHSGYICRQKKMRDWKIRELIFLPFKRSTLEILVSCIVSGRVFLSELVVPVLCAQNDSQVKKVEEQSPGLFPSSSLLGCHQQHFQSQTDACFTRVWRSWAKRKY